MSKISEAREQAAQSVHPGKAEAELVQMACPRCGGSGNVGIYWVEGGRCFECGGGGGHYTESVGRQREREAQRLVRANRAAAKAEVANAAAKAEKDAWRAEHADLITQVAGHGIADDILARFEAPSPKQTELLVRIAAQIAERAVEVKAPVVEGRQVITGKVLKIEDREEHFGYSTRIVWKMTVKDDRGFVVWGTAADAFLASNYYGETPTEAVKHGDRVTFTGTVTASDRDATFGFFKRPAKASRIEVTTAA